MLKCFLPAWLFGWVIAIFLPSAIIAYLGLSEAAVQMGGGLETLPAATWKVADDVGPFAKLSFGALLLVLFFVIARAGLASVQRLYAASALAGLAAMLAAIALLPEAYSRGFGVGLTGVRFDPDTLPIYLLGGVIAGLAFGFAFRRCGRAKHGG